MARIYFSFAAKDRDLVVKLAQRLEARGHEFVMEVSRHIRVAQWREKLLEALTRTRQETAFAVRCSY